MQIIIRSIWVNTMCIPLIAKENIVEELKNFLM